jgi:thiamine-phosphate pyrophosphorylase
VGGGERDYALSVLKRRPLRYAISGGAGAAALAALARAGHAGADLLQVREKAMPDAELLAACRRLRAAFPAGGVLLLVNERWDIARAAGLDGVHLPAAAAPAARVRAHAPGLLIGRSCHSAADVAAAAAEGCDYGLLSPIFPTPAKAVFGPPLGLAELERAAARVAMPVLALGGIQPGDVAACLAHGAAGVAGIRLFALGAEPPAAGLRRM